MPKRSAERHARHEPAGCSPEAPPQMAHVRGAAARPILVVDDDDAIRTAVADILTLEGYLVEVATNGAAGYLAKPFVLAELLAAVECLYPTAHHG